MASNKENIIAKYGDGTKEERRSDGTRTDYMMEFHYTKKFISKYITRNSIVAEIGCGTGYYGMYLSDKCNQYLGIDIVPGNINVFREKIKNNNLTNVKAEVGDAIDLNSLNDNSFDVVLVFGPMYHLPPSEQHFVYEESKRICKNGGILVFAYTNKIGVYMRALNQKYQNIYPNKQSNISVLEKGEDDTRNDIYFFTMPEEIEKTAEEHGLNIIKNVGVDFTFCQTQTDEITQEQAEAWKELYDYMSNYESCTAFSNHALLFCKKQ